MIEVHPQARAVLEKLGGVIRFRLQTSGCCEPTLAAFRDRFTQEDIVTRLNDLILAVDPDTLRITGRITVSAVGSEDPLTLRLETANPISEWFGLADTVVQGSGSE